MQPQTARSDFDDGGTYIGQWLYGCADGLGLAVSSDTTGEYSGKWQAGFETSGLYLWPTGNLYVGTWSGGKQHGHGMQVRGKWVYQGQFSNGISGPYRLRMSVNTMASYAGSWSGNRFDGYGIEKGADGSIYAGAWLKGMRHGLGVCRSVTRAAQPPRDTKADAVGTEGTKRSPISLESRRKTLESRPSPELNSFGRMSRKAFIGRAIMRHLRKQNSAFELSRSMSQIGSPAAPSPPSSTSRRSIIRPVGEWLNQKTSKVDSEKDCEIGALNQKDPKLGNSSTHENVVEIYAGQWKEEKRCGFGIAERSDGQLYVGEWAQNMRHGFGLQNNPDGSQVEGHFQADVITRRINKKSRLQLLRQTKVKDSVDEAVHRATEAANAARKSAVHFAEEKLHTPAYPEYSTPLSDRQAERDSASPPKTFSYPTPTPIFTSALVCLTVSGLCLIQVVSVVSGTRGQEVLFPTIDWGWKSKYTFAGYTNSQSLPSSFPSDLTSLANLHAPPALWTRRAELAWAAAEQAEFAVDQALSFSRQARELVRKHDGSFAQPGTDWEKLTSRSLRKQSTLPKPGSSDSEPKAAVNNCLPALLHCTPDQLRISLSHLWRRKCIAPNIRHLLTFSADSEIIYAVSGTFENFAGINSRQYDKDYSEATGYCERPFAPMPAACQTQEHQSNRTGSPRGIIRRMSTVEERGGELLDKTISAVSPSFSAPGGCIKEYNGRQDGRSVDWESMVRCRQAETYSSFKEATQRTTDFTEKKARKPPFSLEHKLTTSRPIVRRRSVSTPLIQLGNAIENDFKSPSTLSDKVHPQTEICQSCSHAATPTPTRFRSHIRPHPQFLATSAHSANHCFRGFGSCSEKSDITTTGNDLVGKTDEGIIRQVTTKRSPRLSQPPSAPLMHSSVPQTNQSHPPKLGFRPSHDSGYLSLNDSRSISLRHPSSAASSFRQTSQCIPETESPTQTSSSRHPTHTGRNVHSPVKHFNAAGKATVFDRTSVYGKELDIFNELNQQFACPTKAKRSRSTYPCEDSIPLVYKRSTRARRKLPYSRPNGTFAHRGVYCRRSFHGPTAQLPQAKYQAVHVCNEFSVGGYPIAYARHHATRSGKPIPDDLLFHPRNLDQPRVGGILGCTLNWSHSPVLGSYSDKHEPNDIPWRSLLSRSPDPMVIGDRTQFYQQSQLFTVSEHHQNTTAKVLKNRPIRPLVTHTESVPLSKNSLRPHQLLNDRKPFDIDHNSRTWVQENMLDTPCGEYLSRKHTGALICNQAGPQVWNKNAYRFHSFITSLAKAQNHATLQREDCDHVNQPKLSERFEFNNLTPRPKTSTHIAVVNAPLFFTPSSLKSEDSSSQTETSVVPLFTTLPSANRYGRNRASSVRRISWPDHLMDLSETYTSEEAKHKHASIYSDNGVSRRNSDRSSSSNTIVPASKPSLVSMGHQDLLVATPHSLQAMQGVIGEPAATTLTRMLFATIWNWCLSCSSQQSMYRFLWIDRVKNIYTNAQTWIVENSAAISLCLLQVVIVLLLVILSRLTWLSRPLPE